MCFLKFIVYTEGIIYTLYTLEKSWKVILLSMFTAWILLTNSKKAWKKYQNLQVSCDKMKVRLAFNRAPNQLFSSKDQLSYYYIKRSALSFVSNWKQVIWSPYLYSLIMGRKSGKYFSELFKTSYSKTF